MRLRLNELRVRVNSSKWTVMAIYARAPSYSWNVISLREDFLDISRDCRRMRKSLCVVYATLDDLLSSFLDVFGLVGSNQDVLPPALLDVLSHVSSGLTDFDDVGDTLRGLAEVEGTPEPKELASAVSLSLVGDGSLARTVDSVLNHTRDNP
ncbi:hypothetical protein LshimejAT787_1502330 [Lyophyllum shimeji]|uniref:Uncharacterized protein n=1 Tax=Lyophyllum shimeji TaxID=47721 RepID=A0A9P3UQK5_LYOSH|nr:hypothetical protein LshimejAT787_1502330 [Lyophyllum shimeji]